MKRTIERVLTWIGIVLQILGVVLMAVLIPMMGNGEVKEAFISQMMQEDSSFTYEDGNTIFSLRYYTINHSAYSSIFN